jgi:hypothetical protein
VSERQGGSVLFSFIYVSSAVHPFSVSELEALLRACHENNSNLDITGMLLYKDGNFMQVLEGEEATVLKLAAKIHADCRHKGMITLWKGYTDERQFPDWSMGFCDLGSPKAQNIPGYSDFLNTPLSGSEFLANPGRAQKLLLVFKKNTALQP